MTRPANRNHSLYFDYPHYPFVRPREMDGEGDRHTVVVIGAGPVGVTAALELARHGVASIVLDEKNSVNHGSRAICVARHSFEILQQLGLAGRFTAKALPWTKGTSYYRDREVFRLEMPHSGNERFYPMYNIQQQYIEKFLVDAAMDETLVDMRWQSTLVDLVQDENGITLVVDTPEGRYKLHPEYVIAADGARSTTRKLCGLKLEGDTYEGQYVIVDIHLQSDYPTERRAFFDSRANPALTVLVHRQPDDIWRIDYQIDGSMDAEAELQEENIRQRIGTILDSIGETGDWELEWWSIYKAYTLALDDYRHGNVFFAGDAAHLVPIFGVRGLNSGFADAMNIGWKLAWVMNGRGRESLLESYTPERRGATLDVFSNAVKSTRFMTPPSRGYAIMRKAALSLALEEDFTRPLINPRQSQPYTYADSPLTLVTGQERDFHGGPAAGAAMMNFRLAQDDYLLDHLGRGFTGIYFNRNGQAPGGLDNVERLFNPGDENFKLILINDGDTSTNYSCCLADNDGAVSRYYDADDGTFYLVRPDRHVAARWKHLDENELNMVSTFYLD